MKKTAKNNPDGERCSHPWLHPRRRLILLMVAASCIAGHLAYAATPVNVKNFGAKGNGLSDDTTAINAALSLGAATGAAIWFPAGTYLVKPLAVVNGYDLTVYGDGADVSIIKLIGSGPATYSSMFDFGGAGKTLEFHDLMLQGQNYPAPGLSVIGMTTVNIHDVVAQDFGKPFVDQLHGKCYDAIYVRSAENAVVSNCILNGNEREGLVFMGVHYATMTNCSCNGNGRFGAINEDITSTGPLEVTYINNFASNNGSGGFHVETINALPPTLGHMRNNAVVDCGNNQWADNGGYKYGEGLVIGTNAYGDIRNNIVRNFAATADTTTSFFTGIVIENRTGVTEVSGNVVTGSGGNGLGNGDSLDHPVTVTGNVFSNNHGFGVSFYRACAQLSGNTFSNNGKYGFNLNLCPDSQITFNIFYDNVMGASNTPNSLRLNFIANQYAAPVSDTVPPLIAAVLYRISSVATTSATITWVSGEPGDSQVEYGTSTSYGLTSTLAIARVLDHSQTLTGLASGTLYHFRVKSQDTAGNLGLSDDFTFTTRGTPPPTPLATPSPQPLDGAAILVYPNPWRLDKHAHIPLTFAQIATGGKIKIFTMSGNLLIELKATGVNTPWDLQNTQGKPVATGIYFYLVTTPQNKIFRGSFAVIR